MTLITTDSQHYTDIASAIRTQLGVQTTYLPSEMAAAVASISGGGGGGSSLGTKTIIENGTYNASDDSLDGYSSVTVGVPYYIIDPNVLDNSAAAEGANTKYPLAYAYGSGGGGTPAISTSSFDGVSAQCFQRSGNYGGKLVSFPMKIDPSKYSKLYIKCKVTSSTPSGTDRNCAVYFTDKMRLSWSTATTALRTGVYLASDTKTSAEINTQSGVVISSETPTALSEQTVEIDIASATDDFYISIFNDGEDFYIREMYLQ